MSVNLKQVYNAIHDLGREIVMLESHDDGIGIAFETDGGIIRCEFVSQTFNCWLKDSQGFLTFIKWKATLKI